MYESIYIYTHINITLRIYIELLKSDFAHLCTLCAPCSFFDLFLEKKLNKINYLKKVRKEGAQCFYCAPFVNIAPLLLKRHVIKPIFEKIAHLFDCFATCPPCHVFKPYIVVFPCFLYFHAPTFNLLIPHIS
jgi:hypothetical protein